MGKGRMGSSPPPRPVNSILWNNIRSTSRPPAEPVGNGAFVHFLILTAIFCYLSLLLQFLKAVTAFQGLLYLYLHVYVNITIKNIIGFCRIIKKFIQVLTVYHFCWLSFSVAVENRCEYTWLTCECVIITVGPQICGTLPSQWMIVVAQYW